MKFKTVDEYINSLEPKGARQILDLRSIIKKAAPKSQEVISYNMPAFKLNGILCFYASHKFHIGFYPGSSLVIEIFEKELKKLKTSKGTIQFSMDKPIPKLIVKKIIRYRVKQNLEKLNKKK